MNARQRRVERRARERFRAAMRDLFAQAAARDRADRERLRLERIEAERRASGAPHPDVPDEVARHAFARFEGKRPRVFSVDAIAMLRAT